MKTPIDHSLHDAVRPALENDEGLLWVGRPDPWRTARYKIRQTLLGAMLLLLLMLAYISGLPAWGAAPGADAVAFILRPAVIVAGAFLTVSGILLPVVSYLLARGTVYAVTSKRVLSVTRGRAARTIRYEDMQIPLLEVGRDARGDIHFQGRIRTDGTEQRPQLSRFLGIEAAEIVYRLLLGQMLGPAPGRTATRGVEDYLELLLLRKGNAPGNISRE